MTARRTPSSSPGRESFLTTHWSLVLATRDGGERGRNALESLCRAYWYPLYAFVRRSGIDAVEAEDVVQSFFSRIVEKRDLEQLSPERGRFRSFLLVAIRHFVSNWRDHQRAVKRGGGRVQLEADFHDAERRIDAEARGIDDPVRAFDRAWARELLRACLIDLEREYADSERARVFEELEVELQGGSDTGDLRGHAEALAMSEGAVKVALHRLRGRYREKLRRRIEETVTSEDDVQDEIRALFEALGR